MRRLVNTLLRIRRSDLLELALQLGILLFELLDSHLQVLHFLTGADTQFLDNLDETP